MSVDDYRDHGDPGDGSLVPMGDVGAALAPVNLGMLQASTPVDMMRAASAIATPLRKFIEERKLMKMLGGETPFVYMEGWTTMISMLGVMPQEISVEEKALGIPGWGPKYIAKMALVRVADQQVVCSASAECGGEDERDWHFRAKYRWVERGDGSGKKDKVPDGEVAVPGSQRRSMAITRATSKAARIGFSWIMTMAGYNPTPYEELDASDRAEWEDPAAVGPKGDPWANSRDPHDMMGSRSAYTPGGRNPDRHQGPPAPPPPPSAPPAPATGQPVPSGAQAGAQGVRKLNSKFRFDCMVCGGDGAAGEEIAYRRDGEGTFVAHWRCYQSKVTQG